MDFQAEKHCGISKVLSQARFVEHSKLKQHGRDINQDLFKSLAISESISKEILQSNWFKEHLSKAKEDQLEGLRFKVQRIIKEYN